MGRWLADRGISTFVLKYRHGGGVHQHPVPLSDIQRAIRVVRSQSADWKIVSDRVGVMGFSAGGHLASSVGTHFDSGNQESSSAIERQSCRPDFMVLIYPVISMDARITHAGSLKNLLGEQPDPQQVELMSNDKQVSSDTPPTFIAHAADDGAVPVENALRFYRALIEHKVPAELHIFEKGGHGFGMRQQGPVEEWPNLLANWLKSRGLAE
jgi:acetyl esterase/lipase